MGGQSDPLRIVQEVEVWPYEQMVYAQPRICPSEKDTQTPLRFRDTNGSPNLSQTTRSYNNQQQQKKRTCTIVDFAVPADRRVKLKECEKRHKYLDFAMGIEKAVEHESDDNTNCDWCSWYSHPRISTRTGRLVKKQDEWRPPKLLHYWDRPENWEESWRLDGTCCHSNSSEKPSANAGGKNSQKRTNNNNNTNEDLAIPGDHRIKLKEKG